MWHLDVGQSLYHRSFFQWLNSRYPWAALGKTERDLWTHGLNCQYRVMIVFWWKHLLTVTKAFVLAECKELLMSSGIISTWLLNLSYEQMALYTLVLPGLCIVSILATVATLWWAYDWGRGWLAPTECVILSTWWLSSSFAEVNFWWAFRRLSSLWSFQTPLSDQLTIDFPAMLFPNLHHPAKLLVGAHRLVIVALKS